MLGVLKKIFVVGSVLFLTFMVIFYGYRLYYYYSAEHKSKIKIKLSEQIITNSNKLKEIDNVFYFYGNIENNYLYYSGIMYRIINFNNDYLTLIADEDVTKLRYGQKDDYQLSDIKLWLENEYIKNLNSEFLYENRATILDLEDYKNISSEGSFIKSNDMWICDNDMGLMLDKSGNVNTPNSYQYFLSVRPVIKIKNIDYVNGQGTLEKPYILENKIVNSLSDSYVGQYVKYKDNIYRIISKENGIKVVSTKSIGQGIFSKSSVLYNSTSSLYKYLNNNYLATIDKDDLLVTSWKNGQYDNSYKNVEIKTINSYIGLLTIGDYFIQDITGYTLSNSNNTVFTIQEDKSLYLVTPNKKLDVYPAFSIKEEKMINSGLGTKESPYEVGEV